MTKPATVSQRNRPSPAEPLAELTCPPRRRCAGTTTSTILARAMYSEGCKAVAAGMNPMDLRKGVQMATEQVIEELAAMAQPTEVRAAPSGCSARSHDG